MQTNPSLNQREDGARGQRRAGRAWFQAGTVAITLLFAVSARAQDITAQSNLVSSGSTGFSGPNINTLVGADTFYNLGYTGTKTKLANIEAGWLWTGHETFAQPGHTILEEFAGTGDATHNAAVGQFDAHATSVGSAEGGFGNAGYQQGIAYGAGLYSGAIATAFTGATNNVPSTSFSTNSFASGSTYFHYMTSAAPNGKADVVNSSWGFPVPSGYDTKTIFVDALVQQNGTTVVAAAGNAGPGTNSVGGIAAGFNTISVGALGSTSTSIGTNTSTNPNLYKQVADFSSRGPNAYANNNGQSVDKNGQAISAVRARVDIVAPGQDLTLAAYTGTTGGNTNGTDGNPGATNLYYTREAGTSFSSPIVAGGATLLDDVGHTIFTTDTKATDGRVIKAVLLNSADKLAGWSNAAAIDASTSVLTTTQALDYSQGAGALNLSKAYAQYTGGTHDNVGTGGSIGNTGWLFDNVALNNANNYRFASLVGGSTLTATLDWFVNASYTNAIGGMPNYSSGLDTRLDNLYLRLYSSVGGAPGQLIAESAANYITTQHLFFDIPQTGGYILQVADAQQQYTDNSTTATGFGLAWSDTGATDAAAPAAGGTASAPEPDSLRLMFGLFGIVCAASYVVRRETRRRTA